MTLSKIQYNSDAAQKIKQQRGRPPKNWTKMRLPKIENNSEAVQKIKQQRGRPPPKKINENVAAQNTEQQWGCPKN